MTWRRQAACLGADAALFIPAGKGNVPREGLHYCVGCPVRDECLEEALDRASADDFGVWGGTTERVRAAVRAGRLTRAEAMERGDRIAVGHITEQELLEAEPWLADIFAATHAGTVGT